MVRRLISIIIPVYNRVNLVGETLDSIISQTYKNWECIVVDDGSLDTTVELIEFYTEMDNRIKLFRRPGHLTKGANSCRNFGFSVSKGEYVNWFDSDDIMLPENLELKLNAFNEDFDFVVGNSVNYDENGKNSRPYKLDYQIEINPENFITGKIGWITNDVLIRRNKVSVLFNESLSSGQEYNFFSRLLYISTKGKYLKKDTVLRRIHGNSIHQAGPFNDNINLQYFENEVFLLNDVKDLASQPIINRSLKRIMRFSYNITPKFGLDKKQRQVLKLLFHFKQYRVFSLYTFWIFINLIMGRGYFFLKKSYSILD